MGQHQDGKPVAAGKSSFGWVNVELIFDILGLGAGIRFLDVGCGRGPYALSAAEKVGAAGRVYAVDLWPEGIEALEAEIALRGSDNITAWVGDATRHIDLSDGQVEVCLLATVLHDFVQIGGAEGALSEIRRVLRPDGVLGVLEFNKVDAPPGPPYAIRLDAGEVDSLVHPHGFAPIETHKVSPHHYMATYRRHL